MWVKFTKLYKPFYNQRTGEIIGHDISRWVFSRRNPIGGGEIIYPDLKGYKILERYERGDTLLINIDTQEPVLKDKKFKVITTRKIRRKKYSKQKSYSISDFNPEILSGTEAGEIKKSWGLLADSKDESGVTF